MFTESELTGWYEKSLSLQVFGSTLSTQTPEPPERSSVPLDAVAYRTVSHRPLQRVAGA